MEPDEATRAAAERVRQLEGQGGGIMLAVGGLLLAISAGVVAAKGAKGLALGIVGLFMVLSGWLTSNRGKRAAALRTHGLRGEARLLKSETVRVRKDGLCLTRFELEIALPGRDPYEVRTSQWANLSEADRLSRSPSLWVRVDPNDSKRVLLELV